MKKLLVVSLYNGDNEIAEFPNWEFKEIKSSTTKCNKGDRVVWMGEEFLYIEL